MEEHVILSLETYDRMKERLRALDATIYDLHDRIEYLESYIEAIYKQID